MSDVGTRAEHIAWARRRALEYLPHSPIQAIASIASDLTKHSETTRLAAIVGPNLTSLWAAQQDVDRLRRAIEALK